MKRSQWFTFSAIFLLLCLHFYSNALQSYKNSEVYVNGFHEELDNPSFSNDAGIQTLFNGNLLIQSQIDDSEGDIIWLFIYLSGGIFLACLICGFLEPKINKK